MKPRPDEACDDEGARGEQDRGEANGHKDAPQVTGVSDVRVGSGLAESWGRGGKLGPDLASQGEHPREGNDETRSDEDQSRNEEKGLGEEREPEDGGLQDEADQ